MFFSKTFKLSSSETDFREVFSSDLQMNSPPCSWCSWQLQISKDAVCPSKDWTVFEGSNRIQISKFSCFEGFLFGYYFESQICLGKVVVRSYSFAESWSPTTSTFHQPVVLCVSVSELSKDILRHRKISFDIFRSKAARKISILRVVFRSLRVILRSWNLFESWLSER